MNQADDSDNWGPDEEEIEKIENSLEFKGFEQVCPSCKQPITSEMDSCPFCGDIIYRNLADGTFSPRKGPLVKILCVIILLLATLAVVGMVLRSILLF